MNDAVRIAACGDILITRRVPAGHPGIAPVRDYLAWADVSMANLETTITDGRRFPNAFSGGTWLTSEPGCLEDIKRYGISVLGLANNHTMDYAYEGLLSTIDYVEKAGFAHAGTGRSLYEASRPVFISTNNGRVAVIDICSTFDKPMKAGIQTERQPGRPGLNYLRNREVFRITKEHAAQLEEIAAATTIGAFRKKERREGFIGPLPEGIFEFGDYECELVDSPAEEGRFSYANAIDIARTVDSIHEALFSCEAVVVMLHTHEVKALDEWEADYFVEEFAHACIDAGACALIGSGTHQLKGIEIYKDCPIIYGLGNFMFENEYVQLLPADYMEAYHLPLHGSAADGIATRSAQAAASLYTIEEVYQTVIPRFSVKDGKCSELTLLPMSLGKNLPRHLKNIPQPADTEMSEYITSYLNRASAQYGVAWKYDGRMITLA